MTQQATVQPFAVEAIWLERLTFEDVGFEQMLAGEVSVEDKGPGVNYEIEIGTFIKPPEQDDERWRGIVRVTATVAPVTQPTFKLVCAFVARCSAAKEISVPFEQFIVTNGGAYLVPFVRERIASVTTNSRFPQFLLPPVNTSEFLTASTDQAAPTSEPEL